MDLKPGEVWLADLGLAGKTRPVVILSRTEPEPPRALVIYAPLTTQSRGSAYEVALTRVPFLHKELFVNVQGMGSLPHARLERRLGMLPEASLAEVKKAIRFALELG